MQHLSLRRAAAATTLAAAAWLQPAHSSAQSTTAAPPDAPAILWKDPGTIASRDLFWGMGGPERAPQGPFAFLEETTTERRRKSW